MEIEPQEVQHFLAQHLPFQTFPTEVLAKISRQFCILRFGQDQTIQHQEDDKPHLYILRQGAIRLSRCDGQFLDQLEEGQCFGRALTSASSPDKAQAIEDCVLYRLPTEDALPLFQQFPSLQSEIDRAHPHRLSKSPAVRAFPQEHTSFLSSHLKDLIRRPPVSALPNMTIQEAAQQMSREGVSSLLIQKEEQLLGILTDRDLRMRVLAQGYSPQCPVSDVMTPSPLTLSCQATAFEALLLQTQHAIHHLPITQEGRVIGLITSSDLLRQQSESPVYLVNDIYKQETLEGLQQRSQKIPRILKRFVEHGTSAYNIGRMISSLVDALTQRLLALATQRLGPAPMDYVWLLLGSQARQEQSTHSDQDNALLLERQTTAQEEEYFHQLSTFVCDGLHHCGFVYCAGEVMATNPKWRRSLEGWKVLFESWIEQPSPKALMHASIFFDMRSTQSNDPLLAQLRQHIFSFAAKHRTFLAHMARNALSFRPPLGFFRQFVLERSGEHKDTFDIKYRGLAPVVELARVIALSGSLSSINTYDRLADAATHHILQKADATDLHHALEWLATWRLRHHVEQAQLSEDLDNYVSPKQLTPLEKRHLRDAFRVIQTAQNALEQRFTLGLLG